MVLAVLLAFMPACIGLRVGDRSYAQEALETSAGDAWPWSFQKDLSSVKSPAEAVPRFQHCEKIGVVMEGDANRPDMRHEALVWVDFLIDQDYCILYLFDWVKHATDAWKGAAMSMNLGLGWKDALAEVKQSDEGQVVQIVNSTKENWAAFTGGLEELCSEKTCAAKRVVVSFEDHGEYRLLGLPEHKKLLREDLLSGLRSLYRLTPEVKLLSYISACKSGSMFGGPQYTAKELMHTHYMDCDLRDDKCQSGGLGEQMVTVAGHSFVGVRQRVLLRATEAILQGQAMCDLATGDLAGFAEAKFLSSKADLPEEKKHEMVDAMKKELSENSEFIATVQAQAKDGSWPAEMSSEEIKEAKSKARKLLAVDKLLADDIPPPKTDGLWQHRVHTAMKQLLDLNDVFDTWRKLVTALRFGIDEEDGDADEARADDAVPMTIEEELMALHNETQDEAFSPSGVANATESIQALDPSFNIESAKEEEDLRGGSFMVAYNEKVLKAWEELRTVVDGWKASEKGAALWSELTNGESRNASNAMDAFYAVPWGVGCGSIAECLGTFGRGQVFMQMHHGELGCLHGELEKRLEGHVVAGGQSSQAGIEENSGLGESHTGALLKHLLRAIAYSSDDGLEWWDTQLVKKVGKLTTGDFEYKDDAMLGAATTENEPLDLVKDIDGPNTRPESILAFSASVPQIISSSLLPFTLGIVSDIRERMKDKADGEQVDTSFRAHVRSVEDQAVDGDSIKHGASSLGFGLYSVFLRLVLWAKGNVDSTISITKKDAAVRAAEYELESQSGFWKQSKVRKAEFFKAISEGEAPPGFLSFVYTSPATGRVITRYFDTMLSSENFGSPIAFGNMLDTDLGEFFKHNPKGNLLQRFAAFGKEAASTGSSWFENFVNPKSGFADEETRCCCRKDQNNVLKCELLVGRQLKVSRHPFKWGKAVCPSDRGYHMYTRWNLKELPDECEQN